MTKDLPDFQSEIVSAAVQATSFRYGLDAAKPASPAQGDIWLATDTGYLYVSFTAGSWESVAKLYLLLAGGTMSGAIAMGSNKITGLGAPVAAADAARKTDVDTVDARLDDISYSAPSRALGTIYQNTSGKIMVVTVTVRSTTGSLMTVQAHLGAASPPATLVGVLQGGASLADYVELALTFLVKPSEYYRVRSVGTAATLGNWTEYLLL